MDRMADRIMTNAKAPKAVIEANAVLPPPQTSLLLNCVELGSFASETPFRDANAERMKNSLVAVNPLAP
jgi:hypothetical protein